MNTCRCTCLFCEKEFKEWSILKDHMRKKGHKRLDPKNKEYDRFYVINYLVSYVQLVLDWIFLSSFLIQ